MKDVHRSDWFAYADAGTLRRTVGGEAHASRLSAIEKADNPLLEAARPLLRALAQTPEHLEKEEVEALPRVLEHEVRTFQKLCEQANIRRDHVLGARYCLCTALDEAAMQTVWGKGSATGVEWATDGLASLFHEDRQGGDKIYLLIGKLMTEPHEHIDLLEVIYRILSLGFEGRYRYEAGGHRKHEAVRQRLYQEIAAQRGPIAPALSPHAKSMLAGRPLSFGYVPVRIVIALLALGVLGLYGYFANTLVEQRARVIESIAAVDRVPGPDNSLIARVRGLLSDEIRSAALDVRGEAGRVRIVFRKGDMFASGSAQVDPALAPLLTQVAAALTRIQANVEVIGYTDLEPVRGGTFMSNDALSLARASRIVDVLAAGGVARARVHVVGKAEANPVGDNRTAPGRSSNRRVEIVLTP